MFSFSFEFISSVLNFFYARPYLLTLPKDFWSTVSFEWLALQTVLAYTYFRFVTYKNYFKQILALMWVLCVLAIYFAFLQLELFACFMFLAEFTIVMFFYTLFLHLKISVANQEARVDPYGNSTVILLVIILLIAIVSGWARFGDKEGSMVLHNAYKRFSYMIFNDLSFFSQTLLRTNYLIHFLVGIILLFLTLFLFFLTNVYYFLNITRRDVSRQAASKLASQRGYYEQTAEEVQKIITNSRPEQG